MITFIAINILTGVVGACYMGWSIGAKVGREINKKRLGKYSRFNEIVTIKKVSK